MTALRITAKGQVTLKKAILGRLGVRPGDDVEVLDGPEGTVQLRALKHAKPDISAAFGILSRPSQKALTVEEMNEVIGEALADDDHRIRSSI